MCSRPKAPTSPSPTSRAEGTQAVADEITASGGTAKAWTLDVADRDDIITVVNDVAAHFGGLDIIINNAGISRARRDRR